jgi:hypothetical protein
LKALSVSSLRPSLLSSWLPLIYSPFPFFMDLKCNGRLLQLIECIESIKSDVKKKMTLRKHATHVPKSLEPASAKLFLPSNLISSSLGRIFLREEANCALSVPPGTPRFKSDDEPLPDAESQLNLSFNAAAHL